MKGLKPLQKDGGSPGASPSLHSSSPMEAAIRARSLTKRFGRRSAIEDVTFEVAAGEVFGFLGRNGAGKTTTVRVLSTLVSPTAGTAEVARVPVSERTGAELRSRIAVMTEAPGLGIPDDAQVGGGRTALRPDRDPQHNAPNRWIA